MLRKLLYTLVFILGCTSLNAQYKYKIESDFESYYRWGGATTNVNISLVNPPQTTGGQHVEGYTAQNGPIETRAHFRDVIVNSSVTYSHFNKRVNGSNSQIPIRCWQGTELNSYLPALAGPAGRLVVYRIKTFAEVNNYSATSNTLLECQATSLQVHDGSDCSANIRYAVQYQVGASAVWTNLYSYGSRSRNFAFSMSDFPGLTIGQNLRLRLQYDNPGTGTPTYSDILTYAYGACSPNTGSFSVQPTTCSNSADGRFTLNFDRPLNGGEILSMVLRRDNPTTGPIISSLTDVNYTGTSYLWPNDLPSASYYLRYQTEPTGNVLDVGPINITSPSPVTFTTGWTDVDCFGENTGSISIDATGGSGNYQYSINNGVSWAVFGSANNHNVTNLPTGNYQVKVRDANQCIAQQ